MPVGREALHALERLVGHLLHVAGGQRVPEPEAEVADDAEGGDRRRRTAPRLSRRRGLEPAACAAMSIRLCGRASACRSRSRWRPAQVTMVAGTQPAPPPPEAGDEAQHLPVRSTRSRPTSSSSYWSMVTALARRRSASAMVRRGGLRRRRLSSTRVMARPCGMSGCVARVGASPARTDDARGSARKAMAGDKGEVLRSGGGARPGTDLLSQNRSAGRARGGRRGLAPPREGDQTQYVMSATLLLRS